MLLRRVIDRIDDFVSYSLRDRLTPLSFELSHFLYIMLSSFSNHRIFWLVQT